MLSFLIDVSTMDCGRDTMHSSLQARHSALLPESAPCLLLPYSLKHASSIACWGPVGPPSPHTQGFLTHPRPCPNHFPLPLAVLGTSRPLSGSFGIHLASSRWGSGCFIILGPMMSHLPTSFPPHNSNSKKGAAVHRG